MFKAKRTIVIILCLALSAGLAGCLGVDDTDPYSLVPESTGGKDIEPATGADNVFTLNYNPKYSLNPIVATNHSNQLVDSLVYENMLEIDSNFDAIPNIISDWYCNDDGTTWTFNLDTTHIFHDGTQVTGKDVRYSLERAIYSDRFSGRFASYQGCAYDDAQIVVYLGIGDTQLYKLMNIPVIKYGTYTTNREDRPPVGSGPYTFNDDMTQLIAYEGYPGYDTLPVNTIYLAEYTTADEIITAFEDSLIDVVLNDPSSYSNLGFASINEFHSYPTTNLHYVVINHESTIGQYANFRFAMNYAFDREYLEELLDGYAVATPVPMYPTCSLYPTSFASTIDYDLEKCLKILNNAGIMDYDDDGKLELMNGAKDLTITFLLCSDSSAKAGIVNRFKNDMESIGITVEVSAVSWDEYIEALEEGEFDMYYGEIKLRADFDITELFDIRTTKNEDYNINYSGCKDTAYGNYINAYLSAPESEQAARYKALCEYLINNGGLISIGFEKQQVVTHRGIIRGMNPNMGNPLYNFENWEIYLD